ncbi:MAG: hypothetical protein Kilf2KO_44690 [Rhodospirillales bacterium]
MAVYFANAGLLDLNALRVMGVSVKENGSPIGYFGTGLKFALATLLRTGHAVELRLRGQAAPYRFHAAPLTVRGRDFQQVYMNAERLAFTTALGRNWQPWQAYRELLSNALDEGGGASSEPCEADTVIRVAGDGIDRAHGERDTIFLSTRPLASSECVEVHPGAGRFLFYRGVRAFEVGGGLYSYNITKGLELTEDRTIKDIWRAKMYLGWHLPEMDSAEIAEALVVPAGQSWEHRLQFSLCDRPAEAFLEAASRVRRHPKISPEVASLLERHRLDADRFTPLRMTPPQARLFAEAAAIAAAASGGVASGVAASGVAASGVADFEVVETLGPGVLGHYDRERDRKYLSAPAFDGGVDLLAATLLEASLHQRVEAGGETGSVQDVALQRLVQMAKALLRLGQGRAAA